MPAEAVCRLELEGRADPPSLERVHDLVDTLWLRVPGVVPADRYAFETAVIEVAGNIVEHGGADVRLRLWVVAYEDWLEAHFRDTGRAVELPDGSAPVDPLAETGRGIALARAAVDDVAYGRQGGTNRWDLRKRRSPSG